MPAVEGKKHSGVLTSNWLGSSMKLLQKGKTAHCSCQESETRAEWSLEKDFRCKSHGEVEILKQTQVKVGPRAKMLRRHRNVPNSSLSFESCR